MRDSVDNNNWEKFLDDFFKDFNVTVEKNSGGRAVHFRTNRIYVYCQLDNGKQRIKKLEFGRLKDGFVKGVFVNNLKEHLTFLQESIDGENDGIYSIDYSKENKEVIYKFLKVPCETGWTETEFKLDNDKYYKVVVGVNDNLNWQIPLMAGGQQDFPLLGDKLDVWVNVKLGEAFWNNSRRSKTGLRIEPIDRV
jgi:hypothetical protein